MIYRFAVYHDDQLIEAFECENVRTFWYTAQSWVRGYKTSNFTIARVRRFNRGIHSGYVRFSAESRSIENLGNWEMS